MTDPILGNNYRILSKKSNQLGLIDKRFLSLLTDFFHPNLLRLSFWGRKSREEKLQSNQEFKILNPALIVFVIETLII